MLLFQALFGRITHNVATVSSLFSNTAAVVASYGIKHNVAKNKEITRNLAKNSCTASNPTVQKVMANIYAKDPHSLCSGSPHG